MGIIKQLDYETAVLVAAGEMIERPASIVKELVENSIDSGATKITVEIQNGGISLIRCSDNGCGMSKDDLPVSIMRNATSKIRTSTDIASILTLGFRGEALASIAACADLRIRSKQASDDVGAELEIHPGDDVPTITEAPMTDGTTVIVENLFANIPARRKFLKRDATEAAHISDLFEKLALSNPGVAMTLLIDGKIRYNTTGDGNLKHTVYSIFGSEFAGKLIKLSYKNDVKMFGGGSVNIGVTGFIGTPDNTRGNRANQIFYINGRNVRSACLQAALEQSYSSYMEASRFPACVMFLEIPPEFVDVNIHPTKLEVKFVADKPVFEAVYYAVRGALERHIPRPKIDLEGKDIGEVNYELYKMLNKFVPIPDKAEEKSDDEPKRVYNNQKNVKVGQLSITDTAEDPPTLSADTKGATPPIAVSPTPTTANESTLIEYEMVQKNTPSPDGSCQQESYLEAIPEELDRKLTDKDGEPVGPQRMYLGSVAPEVDKQLNAPRQKNIVPDSPLGKLTEDEYAELVKKFQTPDTTLPDVPSREYIDSIKNIMEPKPKPVPEYKIIGEAFLSYVFVETGDKVLVIDKHAAHERIIYEDLKANMKRRLASGNGPKQLLLAPIEIDLPPYYAETEKDFENDIRATGFDFEVVSDKRLLVSAIPTELELSEAREVIETVIDRLASGTGSALITRDVIFEKALYQASCKAAIKIGREYDIGHLKWICDKLLTLDDIKVCPHGRPVAFELTKSGLERQFKRI